MLAFIPLSDMLSKEVAQQHFPVLERFVVPLYDRNSHHTAANQTRLYLLTKKGRSMEAPTLAALIQHSLRTAYQAGHALLGAVTHCEANYLLTICVKMETM